MNRSTQSSILASGFVLLLCGCRDATLMSSSMAPTIQPGEKVTVDYTAYTLAAPGRWYVVVFEPKTATNELWVMRVVALPGETVAFAGDVLTIDGEPVNLPSHLTNVTYVPVGQFGTSVFAVPRNCYFVLGDNSTNANDSRFWGALPRTNILGKVKNK